MFRRLTPTGYVGLVKIVENISMPPVTANTTWVLTNNGAVNFFAMQQRIANLEATLQFVAQRLQSVEQKTIQSRTV